MNKNYLLAQNKKHSLERLLRKYFHLEGANLLELVENSESRLPHDIKPELLYIINIMEIIEAGGTIKDKKAFLRACRHCEKALYPRSKQIVKNTFLILMIITLLSAALFYFLNWENIELAQVMFV